jgi:hypothetical protein
MELMTSNVPRALEFYSLGGAVVEREQDTPYGRIAVVTDPMGAPFRIFMTAITISEETH